MKYIIFIQLVLLASPSFAQSTKDEAYRLLTQNYSTQSRLEARSFAFFESCERRPVKIYGADPIDGHVREIQVMALRKRFNPARTSDRSVLIVPPTGGVNSLDFNYADQLCSHGIETWVITAWDTNETDYILSDEIASHDEAVLRGVVAVRQIVRHMPGRVGILGTSAGGILSAMALVAEPRLEMGVLIAAGANMPEILSGTDQEMLRRLRRNRMQRNQWNLQQYKEEIRAQVILDPVYFGDELSAKKVGTVLALRDKTVPIRQQRLLESLAHAERLTWYDDDHVSTILMAALIDAWKVIEYFKTQL